MYGDEYNGYLHMGACHTKKRMVVVVAADAPIDDDTSMIEVTGDFSKGSPFSKDNVQIGMGGNTQGLLPPARDYNSSWVSFTYTKIASPPPCTMLFSLSSTCTPSR